MRTRILVAILGVVVLSVPALAGSARTANVVTVSVTVSGAESGAIKGSKPEDPKDSIPATNACTRFTNPNFPGKTDPLAFDVSFDNPNVLSSKGGVFLAFYYDPKQVGKPQKFDHGSSTGGGTSLLVVTKPNTDYSVAQPGWAGTVTLNKDLRSGSFEVTNARSIITNAHVTIRGTWRCSVTFVRAT